MTRPLNAQRPLALLPLLAIAAGAVIGCAGEDPVSPLGLQIEVESGSHTLRFDAGAGEVALTRKDGSPLLRFPADALEIGTVTALDDAVNYDPYRLYVDNPLYIPPEITWRRPTSVALTEVTATSLALALAYDGAKRGTLRIELLPPETWKAVLKPEPGGDPVAYFRLRPRVDTKEAFYGLGEYFDDVNHRGKVRAMQLEIMPELESSYNEAHVPVPFVIGTRGWGLFVESPYPGVFALATSAPDLVEAAFGTGAASEEGLTFYVFGGAPLDLPLAYYARTGFPRLPARWALGPWIWRDENKDQAEVESDLNTIRDLDLATTGYWIDRPYATGVNTFDFDAAKFPSPQAMIDAAHGLGFRVALWHTPYLDEADPSTEALRKHAVESGFYPEKVGLKLNKWGDLIDLTNPDAYAWWQGLIRSYTDMGIEGFKMDYGEDVVPGLTVDRNTWSFADGSDERTMHSRFPLFYHRVYGETLPEAGGFLLCRGGSYGDQTNVSVIWPGDLDASFARHGERVTDVGDEYTAVGGLPASIIAGLSLGASGFPFYGADTGGYRHSPPDKELFMRWFEQTALSTVMQIGTSSSNVAWEFSPETGFDEAMLDAYRTYTRLHLRLFPYEWTYAQKLKDTGRPIQRPLGLAYPELEAHPSDTYLFGDYLLVAPVVERGQTAREVLLPPGVWVDYWTGEAHDGGATITVEAPLDRLPLFLMVGGIVPMLRPTIDAIAETTDPSRVDSYATAPGVIHARIAAGPASSFVLFDGAEVRQEKKDGTLTLGWKNGGEFVEGAIFEVVALGEKPVSVEGDGAPLAEHPSLAALQMASSGWAFEPGLGGTLYVKVGPGEHEARAALK